MVGAPALSALGALRAGAGLARLLMPEPVLTAGLTITPSATGTPLPVDEQGILVPHAAAEILDEQLVAASALVIGPGLGVGPTQQQHAIEALTLRALQQDFVPVVVDADALTAMSRIPDVGPEIRASVICTPHPGEFKRLAESLRLRVDPVSPETRPDAANSLAQRLGCVVVLKGAGTVVSDGQRTWTCEHGHSCLATAGTGDVLAGVIAGLLAQQPLSGEIGLYDVARLAVDAHARAGEVWAAARGNEAGLLAAELGEFISGVLWPGR